MNAEYNQKKLSPAQGIIPQQDSAFNLGGCFSFKQCPECRVQKSTSDFYRHKSRPDGLTGYCKSCHNEITIRCNKKQYKKAPQLFMAKSRKWQREHPERTAGHGKKWRRENPERFKLLQGRWRLNNIEKVRDTSRGAQSRRRKTIGGQISNRMSYMIWMCFRKNKNNQRWEKLAGYKIEDLRKHLESKFTNGMTWDLFLQGKIHIDHIIPQSKFNFTNSEDPEFKVCWGLNNLQPLWAKDNLSKNASTMEEWKQRKEKHE